MFLTFFCIFIFQLTSKGTNTYLLRLVVPELLLVGAGDVGDNELHILLNQLALLPGHGLALVSPSPDLRIHSVFK